MKRWQDNPRRRTPDDHGGGGETSGPDERLPTDRRVMRGDGLRTETPEDFGGPTHTRYITIRKIRISDGVEVWNNGRGNRRGDLPDVNAPDPQADAACRAIVHEGGDGFVTFGTPVTGSYYGNIVRWRDGGNSALRGAKSATATAGAFDADFQNTGLYPLFASGSQSLYWLAGTTEVGDVRRHVVQSFTPDSLEGNTTTLLALTLADGDGHESADWRQIGEHDSGVVATRSVTGADSPVPSYSGVHHYTSFVDADGTETATGFAWLGNNGGSLTAYVTDTRYGYLWGANNLTGTPTVLFNGRAYCAVIAYAFTAPFTRDMHLVSFGDDLVVADHGELFSFPRYEPDNPPDTEDLNAGGIGTITIHTGGGYLVVCSSTERTATGVATNVFDSDGAFVRTLTNTGGVIGVDNSGSIFGYTDDVFGGPYLRRVDGSTLAWSVDHSLRVFTPRRIVTTGGYHYFIGASTLFGGDTYEAACVNATTGAIVWQFRHHSDDGAEQLYDGVIVGDYLYVCGEASTYEP